MDSTKTSPAHRGLLREPEPATQAVEPQAGTGRSEICLDSREVLALLNVRGRATLWRLVKNGKFPKPIKIGSRSLWLRREVLAWIEERAAARDAA